MDHFPWAYTLADRPRATLYGGVASRPIEQHNPHRADLPVALGFEPLDGWKLELAGP